MGTPFLKPSSGSYSGLPGNLGRSSGLSGNSGSYRGLPGNSGSYSGLTGNLSHSGGHCQEDGEFQAGKESVALQRKKEERGEGGRKAERKENIAEGF